MLSFKVLQLADLHFTGDPKYPCRDAPTGFPSSSRRCKEVFMSTFIDDLLDAETPKVVVFTSDNIQTVNATKHQAAVDAFTKDVEVRKIPFAVIFGNHNDETDFPCEKVMELVMQKNHSHAQRGPSTIDSVGDDDREKPAAVLGMHCSLNLFLEINSCRSSEMGDELWIISSRWQLRPRPTLNCFRGSRYCMKSLFFNAPASTYRDHSIAPMPTHHHRRRHVSLLQSTALLLLLWSFEATATKAPLVARVTPSSNSSSNASAAEPLSLSFKILQLTDLHFSGDPTRACKDAPAHLEVPCTEALMSTFIDELLDVELPDLVVFSGDTIHTLGSSYQQLAVDAFTKSAEARGIPHAEVLGNHDDDNGFSREDVLATMMNKHYSYTQRGPHTIEGVGNYQLSVQAPVDGPWGIAGNNIFHIYFLDSGGNLNKTKYPDAISRYAWIHESQIQYYRDLSDATKADQAPVSSNLGRQLPLPAVMFFHIPLQEFAEASLKFRWRTGEMNEKIEPSLVRSSLFSAFVRQNEVKAVFAGHGHTNAYCFRKNGLQLCCAGGAGLGLAYGSDDFARRARVIEWSVNSNNERTIRSWKRLFGRLDERYEPEVLFTQESATNVGLESSSSGCWRCGGTTVYRLVLLMVVTVLSTFRSL